MNKGEKEKFLNPYYFIPLPKKKTIVNRTDKGNLTGKVTYEIVTKTPLFIPNPSCDSAFGNMGEHKSYDFYSYKELREGEACQNIQNPVIPGSEIRGMMRCVYEAVTGSCMSNVNADEPIFYRGSMRDFLIPGLLKREAGKIILVKAEAAYWGKKDADRTSYVDGQKLYYRAETRGDKNRKYVVETSPKNSELGDFGYLLRGEKGIGNKKKSVAIFKPVGEKAIIVFDEAYQIDFEKLLEKYEKDSNSYVAYTGEYKKFMEGKKEQYFPVYYKKKFVKGKDLIHISPAAITKWKYANRVEDLLGDMLPCRMNDSLCPACSLFGLVDSESAEKGIASRLRFADAVLEKENKEGKIYCERIDLQELAEPHLSNIQMYLKQPAGRKEWNYDDETEINGRKFYWHHADWCLENIKAEKNTKRNLTVRPVADGVTFTGELYFDHITQTELKQMLYLFDISRNKKSGYKIGMGKPLGLGSIEMRIRSVKLRSFSREKDDFYSEKIIDFSKEEEAVEDDLRYDEVGFLKENHIKEWFQMLMKFDSAKGCIISYPYTDMQIEKMDVEISGKNGAKKKIGGFQWFVENKNTKEDKQVLVIAGQQEVKIPYLKVIKMSKEKNISGNGKKQKIREGKRK